jgi:hypothetical protein
MTGEAAKAPTRLPPDCHTPPVRHEGRLYRQDNEHRSKCLVNVHAKPPLTPPIRRIDRQQSVRWGEGAGTGLWSAPQVNQASGQLPDALADGVTDRADGFQAEA